MTKGALLFAQNNQSVDYVAMAEFCASRIKHYLDIPVSLVTSTNQFVSKDAFDNIIRIEDTPYYEKVYHDGVDVRKKLAWKNTARDQCFDLTPYDETLVLDTDYILSSDTLSLSWQQNSDFLIYKSASDLATWRDDTEFEYINEYSIPFYWATVFWFRKTETTESFFRLVAHIRENWSYFTKIYRIHTTTFRNDYAFSIALHMMNGFCADSFVSLLPGTMYYTLDSDQLLAIDQDKMHFLIQKQQGSTDMLHAKTQGLDVHVMNKFSLLRNITNV